MTTVVPPEELRLIRYGCTNLRIAEFPVLKSESSDNCIKLTKPNLNKPVSFSQTPGDCSAFTVFYYGTELGSIFY